MECLFKVTYSHAVAADYVVNGLLLDTEFITK